MVSDSKIGARGSTMFLRWVATGILIGLLFFLGANVVWSVEVAGTEERLVPHLLAVIVIGLAALGLIVQFIRGAVFPPFVRVLVLWVALVALNLVVRLDFGSASVAGRMVLWAMVGIFFYYVGFYAILTPRAIKRFAAVTIILVSARALYLLWQTGFSMMRGDLGFREVMNKNSFIILWTSPVCHFRTVTLFYRLLFFLSCSVVVLTLKRTAILALGVSILIYALGMRQRRQRIRFRFGKLIRGSGISLRAVFISLTTVAIMSGFAYYRWDDLRSRFLLEGKYGISHGRQLFWPIIINEIGQSSAMEWLVGRGILMVPKLWDSPFAPAVHAHNEWLELLYDFGLLGVVVYLLVHLVLIGQVIRLLRERDYPSAIPLAMIYVSILISGIFGTYFQRMLFVWAIVFAAFMIGDADRRRRPAPPPGAAARDRTIKPSTIWRESGHR